MDSARDILKKIRHIELKTRGLVQTAFSGQYRSAFKGRGMNFEEVREYQPGDDVRAIDWNVTARMGDAFIKKFVEERELTLIRAVTFQSIARTSSPGWYSRTSSKFMPWPLKTEWYWPARVSVTMRFVRISIWRIFFKISRGIMVQNAK